MKFCCFDISWKQFFEILNIIFLYIFYLHHIHLKVENIDILIGTLPKIEARTGAKMKYTPFIQKRMMEFITDITSEYKRIYEIGSRYPDVSLTIVQQAFSNALFDNRREVNVLDFREAIVTSKNIYPDVITKSMPTFDKMFADQIQELDLSDKFEKLTEETIY